MKQDRKTIMFLFMYLFSHKWIEYLIGFCNPFDFYGHWCNNIKPDFSYHTMMWKMDALNSQSRSNQKLIMKRIHRLTSRIKVSLQPRERQRDVPQFRFKCQSYEKLKIKHTHDLNKKWKTFGLRIRKKVEKCINFSHRNEAKPNPFQSSKTWFWDGFECSQKLGQSKKKKHTHPNRSIPSFGFMMDP